MHRNAIEFQTFNTESVVSFISLNLTLTLVSLCDVRMYHHHNVQFNPIPLNLLWIMGFKMTHNQMTHSNAVLNVLNAALQ